MPKDKLDLHGFKTDEVYDAVDAFIVAANASNLKRARIVTGKGTGKVQQTVVQYLKQANYPWQYERLPNGKNNEGVLVVFLD